MTIVARAEPLIQKVRVTRSEIVAYLTDGRVISVPLAWSWRLLEASPRQRANFRVIGAGQVIHWPEVDEDLSAEGMLHGSPAPRRNSSPPAARSARKKPRPRKAANPPIQRSASGRR
ncbi:MAG: DUF2442 domain-containing protein [Planctomycetota bacterium]